MSLPQQHIVYTTSTNGNAEECPSNAIWIGLFIVFLIAAIAFAIWILILYLGGHVGSDDDRIVTLTGASITAEATSVTGTWTTLNRETDKVTLYVSREPFVFNDNGQVVDNNGSVLQDNQTGSNGKIDIAVTNNTSFNAMMIVTGDDTVHYRVFGPKKVFTQVPLNLAGQLFNIRDLNSCDGTVSDSGTYATSVINTGTYRLGSNENTNQDGTSLLVRYNVDIDGNQIAEQTETQQVLCRVPTATQLTQVSLGFWINKGTSTAKPVICRVPNADNDNLEDTACTNMDDNIALENCQWSYNTEPSQPNMKGLNQWCLTSLGPTTINSSIQEPLCLSRNGQALSVTNGQVNTDTWFNALVAPTT